MCISFSIIVMLTVLLTRKRTAEQVVLSWSRGRVTGVVTVAGSFVFIQRLATIITQLMRLIYRKRVAYSVHLGHR